jgi:hypothetical protein
MESDLSDDKYPSGQAQPPAAYFSDVAGVELAASGRS